MSKKDKYNVDKHEKQDKLLEDNNISKDVNSAENEGSLLDDTKDTVVNDAVNSNDECSVSDKNVVDAVEKPDVVPADTGIENSVEPVENAEQTSCENSETSSDQGSSKNDDNEALNKDTEASCENSCTQLDETDEHSEVADEAPTMPEDTNDNAEAQTEDIDASSKPEQVDNASRRTEVLIACIALLCVVFGIIYALWANTNGDNSSDTSVDNPDTVGSQTEFVPTEPDSKDTIAGDTTDETNTSGSGETSTSGSGDATDSSGETASNRFFGNGKVVEDITNYTGKYVESDIGDHVDIGFYVDDSGALVDSSTKETKSEQDLDGAYVANNGYLTVDNVWFGNDDIGTAGAKTLYCDGNTKVSIAKFTNNSNKDGTITLYVGSKSEVGSIRVYDIYVNSELCQYSRDVSYSNSKVDFVTVNWENVYYSGNNNLSTFTISVVVIGADGSTLAKIDNVSITDYIK